MGVARWIDVHGLAPAARWPKIAALRARLGTDAAVSDALALEAGEMRAGSGACAGHVPLAEVIERFGA